MNSIRNGKQLIIAMAAALALSACGKQAPPPPPANPAPSAPAPTPTPPVNAPAPTPAVTPAAAPAGTTFTSVELGNGVNASGNALSGAPTTTFTPKDTIYALVTTNAASANPSTITARWTFGGSTLVNESKRQVATAGTSVTEFHIAKPDGWPTGKYSVAISVDDKPVGSKDFEVK
jgi:hypothetical protein